MNKLLKLFSAAAVLLFAAQSCKKNFDNPPAYIDPNIVANTSIKNLKAIHASAGRFDAIATDIIISGIVVANDKSGNFYKELYIQDETGAIALSLDGTNLYTQFPVGRRVYVKCNGLHLSDYGGMIQLGVLDKTIPNNPSLAGIPFNLFDNYLIGGAFGNPVIPRQVSQTVFSTNMQDTLLGTLIQLNGYEFSNGDLSRTYADTSAAKNSVNLTVKNCTNNSIIIRSSGYSNFAGVRPAAGNGAVTAIYTIFNTTRQLIIRDTADVQFTAQRCSFFEEDFQTFTVNNAILSLTGWKNVPEVGGVSFVNAVFGSTGRAAKVSAFGSGAPVVTSWLITPPVALPAGSTPKLTFTSSDAFDNGATMKVFVSTNYNGSNTPSAATWTQLPATFSSGNTGSTFGPFISSGILNLAPYAGQTIYIGFRYDGTSTKTTTLEVDDVRVVR